MLNLKSACSQLFVHNSKVNKREKKVVEDKKLAYKTI